MYYGFSKQAFNNERTLRWSSHGDMLKQYGTCLAEKLKKYDLHDIELYFDVWKSMNQRFQQRFVRIVDCFKFNA